MSNITDTYDNPMAWGDDWAGNTMHDVNLLLEHEIDKKPTVDGLEDIKLDTDNKVTESYFLQLDTITTEKVIKKNDEGTNEEITIYKPIVKPVAGNLYQTNVNFKEEDDKITNSKIIASSIALESSKIQAPDNQALNISSVINEIDAKKVTVGKFDNTSEALISVDSADTSSGSVKFYGKPLFGTVDSIDSINSDNRLDVSVLSVTTPTIKTNKIEATGKLGVIVGDGFSISNSSTSTDNYLELTPAKGHLSPKLTITAEPTIEARTNIAHTLHTDSIHANGFYISGIVEMGNYDLETYGDSRNYKTLDFPTFLKPICYSSSITYNADPILRTIAIVDKKENIKNPVPGMLYAVISDNSSNS